MADLDNIAKYADNPAMLEKQITKALDTTMDVVAVYGLKIVGAVIILFVGWTLAGFVHNAIMRAGRRAKHIDITLFSFVSSLAKYTVLVFTVVAMLSAFGVQTTSFVAVLGATSLAIGLALQGTLSHVASGLMIIIFRPFRIGDIIEIGTIGGTVEDISLFTTELRSSDNIKIVVPNSVVWRDYIKNLTGHDRRRIRVEVAMPYLTDTEDMIASVEKVVAADSHVMKDPKPVVTVAKVTEVAVTLLVDVWVSNDDMQRMPLVINRQVKKLLDEKRAAAAAAKA